MTVGVPGRRALGPSVGHWRRHETEDPGHRRAGRRRHRGRVRRARRPAGHVRLDHPVPDRGGDDRRRHERRRGDRHGRAERVLRRQLRARRPISPAPTDEQPASTTWTVTDLKVKVGDTVKAGQVLATADTADLKRQLADANTAVDTARISLRAAKANLSDANDADVTAQIRQAKIGVNNAETQLVDRASRRGDDLQTQIKLATLTSPIDGIVTTVNVAKGLEAPTGDAIVIDAATFDVTADVVESDLASMAVGQTATVAIAAVDAQVTGKVTAIAPTAVGDTTGGVVSYAVTVSLQDVPAAVRAGMTADVTITIDSATNVLTVPAAALRGSDRQLLRARSSAPTARRRPSPSRSASITNTTAEIKSGLTDGQQVVTGVNTAADRHAHDRTGGFGVRRRLRRRHVPAAATAGAGSGTRP